MAHTNISAISQRYRDDFATVVLTWAARARTVDVSLSVQGGPLTCVCMHDSARAALLAQALFKSTVKRTIFALLLHSSFSSLFIAPDRWLYITFQTWNNTNLPFWCSSTFVNMIGHDSANLKKKKLSRRTFFCFLLLIIKLWRGSRVKNLWAQIDRELE